MSKKRLLAIVISITMIMSFLPTVSFADSTPVQNSSGYYELDSADDLFWFAGLVNGTLNGVAQNDSAKAVLTADIVVNENLMDRLKFNEDGSVANDSEFREWTPIGISGTYFSGTFDGQGHTISGLYINDLRGTSGGLSSFIGDLDGSVKNLGLIDSYIGSDGHSAAICGNNFWGYIYNCYSNSTVVGRYSAGGICCNMHGGTISSCYNTGKVSSNSITGGIIATSRDLSSLRDAQISNCYNTGTVIGGDSVGGVCGSVYEAELITGCYNTGTVTGNNKVGGIAGYYGSKQEINNCYNEGKISGISQVGGVFGSCEGEFIENVYNIGEVSGNSIVGGLCGSAWGIFENSYNAGAVHADTNAGALIGEFYETNTDATLTSTINKCYYLENSAVAGDNNTVMNGVGSFDNTLVDDGKNNAVSKTSGQFASGEVCFLLSNGIIDGTQVWYQTIGEDATPVFSGATVQRTCSDTMDYANEVEHYYDEDGYCICDYSFETPTLVTELNYSELGLAEEYIGYYALEKPGHIYWLAHQVKGGNLSVNAVLLSDITINENLTERIEYDENGAISNDEEFKRWTPIGHSKDFYFSGIFDGMEHTISGLYYNNSQDNYVGLFGYTDSAEIRNVSIEDSYFVAGHYMGSICGISYNGKIKNCHNSADVSGYYSVGGICGISEKKGIIEDCTNTGDVNGNERVGGICGHSYYYGLSAEYVAINNCLNSGNVSGNECVGGVCGYTNTCSAIEKSSNTGNVAASGNEAGGISGRSDYARMKQCYNTGDVTAAGYNVGGISGYFRELSNMNGFDSTITQCYNTGNVEGAYNVGGLCGYNYEAPIYESYNIGNVSGGYSVGAIYGYYDAGYSDKGVEEDCYYLVGSAVANGKVQNGAGSNNNTPVSDVEGEMTAKTAEQFASGEVCYLLNSGTTIDSVNLLWRQNVNNGKTPDKYPKFEGGVVVFGYNDETGENEYINKVLTVDEENGILDDGNGGVCYEQAKWNSENEYYEISNAGQLYWFAEYVNSEDAFADAVFTKDIIINENLLDRLIYDENGNIKNGSNFMSWTPIGYIDYLNYSADDEPYQGTFDGQGHTISGLCIFGDTDEFSMVGLFGDTEGEAIIKNVGITDSYISGYFAGGICGNNSGTIQNCYNHGIVKGNTITGGISAYNYGVIDSCYNVGLVDGVKYIGAICGRNYESTAVLINNYYIGGSAVAGADKTAQGGTGSSDNTPAEDVVGGFGVKTVEQFASGEVCYLLNGDQSDIRWYQILDEDEYPVLTEKEDGIVYLSDSGVYSNSPYETVASGNCGENVVWIFDEVGNLTIKGSGGIDTVEIPWSEYLDEIMTVTIKSGITGIGADAFNGCVNITEIIIPASVKSVGDNAFADCSVLEEVIVLSDSAVIGAGCFDNCSEYLIISGYAGSTIEEYSNLNGYTFNILPNPSDSIVDVVYGDEFTLEAEISAASELSLLSDSEIPVDYVGFYISNNLLGMAKVTYTDETCTYGSACLTITASKNYFEIGENKIKTVYGGSRVLNGSQNENITVNLLPREIKYAVNNITKVYDGTTDTAVSVAISNRVGNDDVTVTADGKLASADVNKYENILLSDITLSGADSEYYTISDVETEAECTAEITPRNIADENIIIGKIADHKYTGEKIKPEVTITYKDMILTENDFEVGYSDDIIGEVSVTITGKGNYTGKRIAKFNIPKVDSVVVTRIIYGNSLKLTAQATGSENVEFYSGNVLLGTAEVDKETGIAKFIVKTDKENFVIGNNVIAALADTDVILNDSGSNSIVINLTAKDINSVKAENVMDCKYTGSAIEPAVVLMDGTTELTADDYSVVYNNNTESGISTITVIGKEYYTGTKVITFNIYETELDVLSGLEDIINVYKNTDSVIVSAKSGIELPDMVFYIAVYNSTDEMISVQEIVGEKSGDNILFSIDEMNLQNDENVKYMLWLEDSVKPIVATL